MTSLEARLESLAEAIPDLPEGSRLHVLSLLQAMRWREQARPEQLPPSGDWRTWYLQAGRGAGKTRAGAEWLSEQEAAHSPGSWAIIAPTFGDGRDTCVEETLLPILGDRILSWNRGFGEIFLRSGSRIYVDGANDGALRIQGKNLRGAWCDEVGLWEAWDRSWNESILFAVRFDPAQIVATGTPKMGHPLVRQLVEDETVIKTRMRTKDNEKNLPAHVIKKLYAENANTLRGRQELDGEWISALEGDLLKRHWWRYFDPKLLKETQGKIRFGNEDPRFQMVVVSVDTPLKDKHSSDRVAIQVWGVDGANRYLLNGQAENMGYDQARRSIIDISRWTRKHWQRCQHRVLIENAGYGPELITDLSRDIGLIEKITSNAEGTKGMRALAAAGDLETGNVFLPGKKASDGTGPDERSCPAFTISLIEEAALFQLDGSHGSHDDQVDAWSQCMNWLRRRSMRPARAWSSFKTKRS